MILTQNSSRVPSRYFCPSFHSGIKILKVLDALLVSSTSKLGMAGSLCSNCRMISAESLASDEGYKHMERNICVEAREQSCPLCLSLLEIFPGKEGLLKASKAIWLRLQRNARVSSDILEIEFSHQQGDKQLAFKPSYRGVLYIMTLPG